MKIGFYGGTFDPIHLGHLFLAVQLKEAWELDQVWLCPAQQNPFKERGGGASIEHRLAMARLAVKRCPFIKVIEHEAQRPGPSYTIETLKLLKKEYPQHQFALLLGEDSLVSFEDWEEAEEIARTMPIYSGSRMIDVPLQFKNENIKTAIEAGWTPLPRCDISATQIRKRLAHKDYCGHLLNQEVLDYISEFNLY